MLDFEEILGIKGNNTIEASTRGTMALNLDTLEIHNVEVVKGIKIIDNLGGCAISFEASDMKLARFLIRPEKKEGE